MSAAMEEDRAESIRMIRDSAAGIAPRGGDRRRIRELRFREPGYDPAMLRQMGEQGWIGLRVPEALGGAGLGLRELCALTEELGAALVPEPLIPAALSAVLLTAAEAEEPLQQMLSGETLLLTAWQEAPATLEAPGHAGAPRLFIPAAGGATGFLVPVAQDGRMALRLQQGGAGLTLERAQDGGFLGTLQPGEGKVIVADIGPALQDALDEAALATAAYLLGVMDQAFALTLDYLRTRQQFGRPIGSFQALQHRAADLKIQVALTRASIDSVAALIDRGDAPPAARRAAVSRAKARAADAALLVTRQAIQFHGGIGYTDEADIGLYLRKAMVLANAFGSAAFHRRRFAADAREDEA
ncbi:acyl-CoA dehydrogenase [Pseudoroseomonas wenyumeiae]|uniref:Acyl-CoA dehydrogenase n=1 Tax=Teichococcus wenyumeiae TaxID=2478470 RepID=A0A3A9JLU6_9PROT|nr:acyl-CoA dehydrogenase family protein [Pseudoroseomonas wenyumeiae]RKK05743.1 acyl-CoA dehydrogenase [Pseudoroseomonas wenyumeiae]RMI24957.1 acyl-CoA dehydrogenase [Pseudoroseomonas wenyumeiae]